MTDQDRLDKLQRLEDAARKRSRRYLDNAKASGKRQISAIVSAKAYDEICRRRDASAQAGNALTSGEIIEQALFLGAEG